MPNHLPFEKKCRIIHQLVEGLSIRAAERIEGVHRDTIMRLAVRVGNACAVMLNEKMAGLTCDVIQIDEMWGFVGKKQRLVTPEEDRAGLGDVWIYLAVDQKTRLVPTYLVGKRDFTNTALFANDLASRITNRPTIYSDASNAYISAVDEAIWRRRGLRADREKVHER